MRIVFISDTHDEHDKTVVPDGDVLVHAGDFTMKGKPFEIIRFIQWWRDQPHKYKVLVPGNHDFLCQKDPYYAKELIESKNLYPNNHYLVDDRVKIEGLWFYGSPWQPWFHDWAFNAGPKRLARIWECIPDDTDILITHGPPFGILDEVEWPPGKQVGCEILLDHVENRIKPKIHVFGHIHESYGKIEKDGTVYLNASLKDRRYRLVNQPHVIDV